MFYTTVPKKYDSRLLDRVLKGVAYVITAVDYRSLPTKLQLRYYPLFRRADTTYRLYPRYMATRKDVNPKNKVVTLVPRKNVYLTKPIPRYTDKDLPSSSLHINNNVSIAGTELRTKAINKVLTQTMQTVNNYVGVKTQYSRY